MKITSLLALPKVAHLFVLALTMIIPGCTEPKQTLPQKLLSQPEDHILINQLGYPIDAPKRALLRIQTEIETETKTGRFVIQNKAGENVMTGIAEEPQYWDLSGDVVAIADFSDLKEPGEYTLCVGEICSHPFEIGAELYQDLSDAALKSYYYARAGVDIEAEYGGKWHYKGGHPDTEVFIHPSAADKNRPANSTISSPGGWYDAGDYGKYIVNSGITTWTIIQSLRLNRAFHETQNLNIPESGNTLPDILDEALVNLKWMMTMQDPNDGGVYHKLTTKNFDGFIMPAETSKPRYVVMKSTSATLDFTATMANASRVIREYVLAYGRLADASTIVNLTELASEMEQAAKKAWQWALKHPDIFYEQPEDIFTGTYADTSLVDEWFWAAAEMYLTNSPAQHSASQHSATQHSATQHSATKHDSPKPSATEFRKKIAETYQLPITPKWDVVNSLGVISVLTSEKRSEFPEMERDFMAHVTDLLEKEASSPYHVSLDKFAWGSNSDAANDGMLKLVAWQLSGDPAFANSAQNDLDYILGRNATGYSFVTGFGDKTPMHPHNRIMGADNIDPPIPGFISGGPNINMLTDCEAEGVVRSRFPAASFTDTECSYSTNETAINWNAPLVFLTAGLEQFYGRRAAN